MTDGMLTCESEWPFIRFMLIMVGMWIGAIVLGCIVGQFFWNHGIHHPDIFDLVGQPLPEAKAE